MRNIKYIVIIIFGILCFSTSYVYAQDKGPTFQSLISSGDKEYANKEYIKAKTYYQEALRLKPKDASAKSKLDNTLQKIREENRKEELYSQAIPAGKRRYFFDVKETRGGDKFITITESRRLFDNNTGEFYYDKNKIFLYKEDFEKFQKGLANALSFIETGIEPEPVVVENDFDYEGERRDYPKTDLEDIDFKF